MGKLNIIMSIFTYQSLNVLKSQRAYVCLFDKLIISSIKKNISVNVIKKIFLKKGKLMKTHCMRYQKCYIKDFHISRK